MSNPKILVIGDVALECGVAVEPAKRVDASPDHSIRLGKPQQHDGHFAQLRGGAWRILEYIQSRIDANGERIQVSAIPEPMDGITVFPDDKSPPLLFVDLDLFWSEMRWDKEAKLWLPKEDRKIYRVEATVARRQAKPKFYLDIAQTLTNSAILNEFNHCNVLVICDRHFGFRRAVSDGVFKDNLRNALSQMHERRQIDEGEPHESKTWIVLETTDPLDEDQKSLLNTIGDAKLLDSTVVVLSANSLKASGIVMRDDLSLERAVEDFVAAISKAMDDSREETDKVMNLLKRVKCFVIRLGTRAALIWTPPEDEDGDEETAEATPVADDSPSEAGEGKKNDDCERCEPPRGIGRTQLIFGSKPYEPQASPAAESSDLGTMHGYSSILAAEIAIRLSKGENSDVVKFSDRIATFCAAGLTACRRYFTGGLGSAPGELTKTFERLCQANANEEHSDLYFMINGENARNHPGEWTILQTPRNSISHSAAGPWVVENTTMTGDQEDITVEVVRQGVGVLRSQGVPFVKHVNLATADRQEIEHYSGIASLITKYMDDENWEKPLCLGVFGPPGCGKSFGIDQVVQAITGYKTKTSVSRMTFNLSQFTSSEQLARAFHKVRNEGLAGELPLVFVDEFDSGLDDRDYGWLKYLLAPMQDGQFLDGDTLFHLPRCILVFIGGQNRDFVEFESRLRDENFIAAKGRDFISRLRHYLVVKGPDLPGPGDKEPDHWFGRRLRRAMVLRSVLERFLPLVVQTEIGENDKQTKRANIDERVIEAFLSIDCYKHGVRSLEAIVNMSRASVTRHSFQKSSLPSAEQLDLHVDAGQFLKIVNGVSHRSP